MSNTKVMADAVSQFLRGSLAAQRAVAAVRGGTADPDLLHAEVLQCDGEPERLRGFLREVQKTMERSGGVRHG